MLHRPAKQARLAEEGKLLVDVVVEGNVDRGLRLSLPPGVTLVLAGLVTFRPGSLLGLTRRQRLIAPLDATDTRPIRDR